jgi:hypothetical protein
MNPPVLRAPNGVMQDGAEFNGAGNPYYDPAQTTVPTLLVLGEWDRDTPPYIAQTLFPLLVNAPGKRFIMLAEGTHTMKREGRSPVHRLRARASLELTSRRRPGGSPPDAGSPWMARRGTGDDRMIPVVGVPCRPSASITRSRCATDTATTLRTKLSAPVTWWHSRTASRSLTVVLSCWNFSSGAVTRMMAVMGKPSFSSPSAT